MNITNTDPANGINYFDPRAAPPQLVNPPGRMFGSFSDGSPIAPNLPQHFLADDMVLGGDDGTEHPDAKRRRIARACDMCRKKKIKCDGRMPACTHCQNYKTECIFTQVEKKRNPPKGAKYIEGLENRLGRMESLLRLSGLLSDDDDGRTDLGTLEKRLSEKAQQRREQSASAQGDQTSTTDRLENGTDATSQHISSPGSGNTTSPEPQRSREEEVEALSDMMCSLVTNNCGETRYIGSSSGFSIFSPKGIQWVNEKTGDHSFQDMITNAAIDDNKWIHWKSDVFRDIFQRRVFRPLPSKNEALSLLKDYFENFNCMFPLFHEPTFMHLVDKHYSREPYEGSGWWASLNIALAIGHRLRVVSNLVPQEEDQKAWGYLKNALAVQTELTMRNTDLLSIQALLGMALFLQGTPNPQPSFFLVAAAIRLSHSIGLHKRGSGFGLNRDEIEQRKRVFWIGYMLDRDICLRSGRPPIQDDDDMNVELPSEDPPDNVGNIPLADGKGKINLFRLMCTFAAIASKVYKNLYSVKATKQSDGELLNTIGELDRELEEWKDGIPIDFRPEHEIRASHTPLILHVVVLHFAYYNCLTTIHRMSIHHGYWTSRLSNYAIQGLNARPLNPRVFSSAALCVSAARASIHLIKYIPHGDCACVWLVIYYPVSALVTLFANVLQNPQDTRARSDLKLMNLVVTFLSALCSDEENSSVRRMLSVCAEFERISNVVIEKAERDRAGSRKRKATQDPDGMDSTSRTGATTNQNSSTHTPSLTGSGTATRSASPHSRPLSSSLPTNNNEPSVPGNIPNVFSPPEFASDFTLPAITSSVTGADQWPGLSAFSSPAPGNPLLPVTPRPSGLRPSPQPNGSRGSPGHHGIGRNTLGMASVARSPGGGQGPTSGAFSGGGAGGGVFAGADGLAADMGNSFQYPFVPQDLWQMPMTLEWDWADLTQGYGDVGQGMGIGGVQGEGGGQDGDGDVK
ncbi:hypothetical protein P152DRAFT_129067 [Eremomyces bilateralis CBS 781.70]|uniref:Zn(2)-C6 fungal-type domain-containing protein n=1 Tax=Eremomyces bilateralis CBS 781.70 TaxID=1392243 RepID=A0A6G1GFF3_9PEZI|nr:uncharacterized protein P152DRAFT_129067 [Eremomyces bilateralis CBS 781.70]KAF1816580.1 hypothetical protein P152DRAFT_129067 [Eremomyces bilateralis CBS 781.70]